LHYLVLTGRASWEDVGSALRDEADFLRDWVATERVQTNEPRRAWWLVRASSKPRAELGPTPSIASSLAAAQA
jgi:hypothetical protein